MIRLAIADPPYPPAQSIRYDRSAVGRLVMRSRAQRYYGDGTRCATERPADHHPDAAAWDDPARHRALLVEMADTFDGWAIATTPDGLAAYGDLPVGARIMAWVRPNGAPGGHRIRSAWEAVIAYPPVGRRAGARGHFAVDVLVHPSPRIGFPGAKPAAWTHWVLDALGYEAGDEVADLFPGSGSVAAAVATYTTPLFHEVGQ